MTAASDAERIAAGFTEPYFVNPDAPGEGIDYRRPTEAAKSYRTVPMCDPEAMISAAAYLEREWGSGRRLGFAGFWSDGTQRTWHVFQCLAGDGSRWLIRCDGYGNVGTFDKQLEREIALRLDVEVN